MFYSALCLESNPMNAVNGGMCNINKKFNDGEYNVEEIKIGGFLSMGSTTKNPLTGSTYSKSEAECRFTCTELEVYALS